MTEKVDLNTLRQKQGTLTDAMETLVNKAAEENRDFEESEAIVFADLETEHKNVSAMLLRAEKVQALKASLSKPVNVAGNQTRATASVAAAPRVRYGKLKAFRGEGAEENAYRSGMFIRAALFGDTKAATWCNDNGIILRAQSEGVNTAGGFLVPTEFSDAIIDLREDYGVFRTEVGITPMASDSMTIPRRAGGLTAYFVGENGAMTESQKSWDQVQLVAKKLAVLSRLSTELAEDAVINIADDLAKEMAYAFAKKEDDCGWNGDGTSNYGGIVGVRQKMISGSHTKAAINAASGHDTFAEVDLIDLTNLMAACPKYAEPNAKFYCSMPAWSTIFQRLIAAAGGNSTETLTSGKIRRAYLGYEVVIDQSLPTSTGSLVSQSMLFFGDLNLAAHMGERRGITVKTSGDRYFEADQIAISATERLDLVVSDLGSTTDPSPLVGLIGA